ncbi:eukaryotic translation initiation factor eIF2A [Nucleospora cyclopteri]
MPVIALSEVGLIIDVFGKKPKIHKSTEIGYNGNHVISYYNQRVKFINIENDNVEEIEIGRVKEIKMSKNGQYASILLQNNDLKIFDGSTLIFDEEKVDDFHGITNSFFYFTKNDEVHVFNLISQPKNILKQKATLKYAVDLEDGFIFLLDKIKDSPQKIFYFSKEGKLEKLFEFPQAYEMICKESNDDLLLAMRTCFSSITYFPETTLFYLKNVKNGPFSLKEDEKYKSNICKSDSFYIYKYQNISSILDFGFLSNNFYICFGKQPANVLKFSKTDGKLIGSCKKITRNFVSFNKGETRVLSAAYGNFPGIITVTENNKITCEIESLGSTVFMWLNDNSRFLVATTNYFKEGNKIDVYDYYGNKLETMECKNLSKVFVYGPEEPEKTLEAPEKLNVIVKDEIWEFGVKNKPMKDKKPPKKEKTVERTVKEIEKELKEARKLQKRMQSGENLSLEDENKVFSIKILEEELSNKL